MTTIEMLEKAFWKLTNKYNIKYYNAIETELKVLEVLYKYSDWRKGSFSLDYLLSMADYWESEHKLVTKERLESYDIPFTEDEFDLIVRWLRSKKEI